MLVEDQIGIYVPLYKFKKTPQKCVLNKRVISPNLNDDYRITHSEEEDDPDQLEDEHTKEEEISSHLLQAFGSTMNTSNQDIIQQVIEKDSLSPRGQKEKKKKNKQSLNSNSSTTATVNNSLNTRSKSEKS